MFFGDGWRDLVVVVDGWLLGLVAVAGRGIGMLSGGWMEWQLGVLGGARGLGAHVPLWRMAAAWSYVKIMTIRELGDIG